MRHNFDLAIWDLADRNLITQVTRSALDLDLIVEKFLECAQVEDLIGHRLRAVDGVLFITFVSVMPVADQNMKHCSKITALINIPSW